MAAGLFEPHVAATIDEHVRLGSAAVDAGAHIGYFTLMMAAAVGPTGHVEAFECDPRVAPRLRDHVELNNLAARVNVNEVGVWREDGAELELKLAEMPGWSYLGEGMWEPVGAATVKTVTLDAHLARRGIAPAAVSFIKIDIEGAEPEALAGMHRTLDEGNAVVVMEFQDWAMQANPGRSEAILRTMAKHSYEPYTPTLGRGGRLVSTPGVVPALGEDVLFVKS